MAYWLMKSEPNAWSWDQQVKKGAKGEPWTGVRNHSAKLNLMKMKKGDRAFFYHSNIGKEIVGIVEIIREHYHDPTAEDGTPWVVVDVKAIEAMPKPVTSGCGFSAIQRAALSTPSEPSWRRPVAIMRDSMPCFSRARRMPSARPAT